MLNDNILDADFLISGFIRIISILVVTTVFEFTKAFVSVKLGDNLPKQEGRLTLNPIKHFEPIGFILFLFFGYGWGRPVECSSMNYRLGGKRDLKSRRICTIAVNLAPMLLSVILAIVLKAASLAISNSDGYLFYTLAILSGYFAAIAVFNIIPVYPMCGSKILKSLLSPNASLKFSQYEKIIQMVVVFMLLIGWLSIPLNFLKSLIFLPVYILFGAL